MYKHTCEGSEVKSGVIVVMVATVDVGALGDQELGNLSRKYVMFLVVDSEAFIAGIPP